MYVILYFSLQNKPPKRKIWADSSQAKSGVTIRRKLVIIGDGASGKTCLLFAFSKGKFPDRYIPTVFENYVANLEVNGIVYEIGLWDTAGQEDYDRLRVLSYPDTDVVLITCCVDSPDSYECVRDKWIHEIRHFCPNVPVILVATKKDLRNDPPPYIKRELQTTYKEGEELAEEIGAYAFLECSAKTSEGVREVFETAMRATEPRKKAAGCTIQ